MPERDAVPTSRGGYTIIELVVSAAILAVCVAAVITMLRKGRDLEINGNVLRQARSLASSTLEDTVDFHWSRYPVTPGVYNMPPAKSIYLTPAYAVTPTVRVTVSPVTIESWGGFDTPFQHVTATVRWTLNGVADSTLARRRIVRVIP